MITAAHRERPPRPSWRERKAAAAAEAAASRAMPDEELPPKLGHSLRELFSTASSIVHTRIALAGIELEEEIQRLLGAAVMGIVMMVAGFMALVVATFTIVLAVPPDYRVGTMIAITLVYVLIVLVLALRVRAVFKGRPPIFGATLAELEKDKDTLMQLSRARHVAEAARERAKAGDETAYTSMTPSASMDRPQEPPGGVSMGAS